MERKVAREEGNVGTYIRGGSVGRENSMWKQSHMVCGRNEQTNDLRNGDG